MCVAVLVETTEGPTDAELFKMEDSNPHGAGLAWASGNLVRYKKGLTHKQVSALLKVIPRPALLHFRWATHGGKARHLTHPFPLGERALRSRKLNSAAPAVLIHNGVWHDYDKFIPPGVDGDKWSDTAVAAYVAGIVGEDILDHVNWSTAVGRSSGHNRMDVTLRGDWKEHNGNMYSNLTWMGYQHWKSSKYYGASGGSYTYPYGEPMDPWEEYWTREEYWTEKERECSYPSSVPTGNDVRWNSQGQLVSRGESDPMVHLTAQPSARDTQPMRVVTEDDIAEARQRITSSNRLLPAAAVVAEDDGPEAVSQWFDEFWQAQRALAGETDK